MLAFSYLADLVLTLLCWLLMMRIVYKHIYSDLLPHTIIVALFVVVATYNIRFEGSLYMPANCCVLRDILSAMVNEILGDSEMYSLLQT